MTDTMCCVQPPSHIVLPASRTLEANRPSPTFGVEFGGVAAESDPWVPDPLTATRAIGAHTFSRYRLSI
ncbi:hypothetical protein RHCRD62_40683 [Rhodococcus sp. RD6.2]|nr:hypothetical protein RHCRD62_40683 [Rhodococcus sp. RD6.2]